MKATRVCIYGEADEPGSGAWCYAESLREMGCSVTTFNPSTDLQHYRRGSRRLYRRFFRTILPRDQRQLATRLREHVTRESSDILIVLKGLYMSAADISGIRAGGCWVVNINHDDFFSVNANNWSLMQRDAIPYYDFIFTTREVNVSEISPLNRNVEFFPFAYYPRIHRPVASNADEANRWKVDVTFVGTWEEERCAILEHLISTVPANYSIHGGLWQNAPRNSEVRRHLRSSGVLMDDMAKAIGGAKIALGFLRRQSRDDYTQRTFEIPACGGVLLAERTARHQEFYTEGVEAEFFDPASSSELCAKVVRLLSDHEKRERMRVAGRAALLRQRHTYRDRLERLLELYERRSSHCAKATY